MRVSCYDDDAAAAAPDGDYDEDDDDDDGGCYQWGRHTESVQSFDRRLTWFCNSEVSLQFSMLNIGRLCDY